MYDRLPLHIRIHIVPEDIDVQGNTATVQAAFYLRRLFGDPNDAPAFAKAQSERITLQLIKTGNQWAVKDMANFATRLSSTVLQ